MPDVALLITCEHAVNFVPVRWQHLFANCRAVLDTHRAWDPGALELARKLAGKLTAPCFEAKISRLLVEHNRSPHHRSLWSEFSQSLSDADKQTLLDDYYRPFRAATGSWIADQINDGSRVIHISVHSFTPVLDGCTRDVDIGILYDAGRADEAFFADLWKSRVVDNCPGLRVRFNVPYRGRSDCHQTTYRGLYKGRDYIGLELEVNQALVGDETAWRLAQKGIIASLRDSMTEVTPDE